MQKLLIADDDREFCELLQDYFSSQGFAADSAHDGIAAIEQLGQKNYDAMILDIMMPRQDGLETLRQLRHKQFDLPVIMLTARGEDVDRIVGLELGADDYLPKPANPRELLARLRAILRRSRTAPETDSVTQIEDIIVNIGSRTVHRNDEPIALTSAEFDVCRVLVSHAGTVVSKEQLAEQALGRRLGTYDRSLDMHISKLRRKLGTLPNGDSRIKTVRNRGYLYVQAQS